MQTLHSGSLSRCHFSLLLAWLQAGPHRLCNAQVSPQNLAERVLHVFAENNIPVHQPFALPGLRLQLDCPGKPRWLDLRVPIWSVK